MYITRKAEFSASHFCRSTALSDEQNFALYGEESHPAGHGHNFIVEVSVEGEPDPITGMVMDLKDLKEILDREVVDPMDHRFLNYEVEPFHKVIPTTANIALEIWQRLEKQFQTEHLKLARVRLFETADLYVDVVEAACL